MAHRFVPKWIAVIRPQDLVWLLLFGVLAYTLPHRDIFDIGPLVALAIVQMLEPKIPALASTRGRVLWTVLKLGFAYVFIGFTGSITSRYWWVMLLPVVSAATALGVVGTMIFAILAGGAYLSFLLFIEESQRPDYNVADFWLRAILFGMVGNLVNILAEELRLRSTQYRQTAERLAEANVHVQAAEEAVRRSDRLAALGQLSAGLAHELRNPLATIRTSAEMLTQNLGKENEVAREVAGFIASEVDRANSLVTRFLQFARPLQVKLEKADLAQTLDRAVALVEREAPDVAIYKNYQPDMPPFPFDAELLERVFYNLLLNAAQATSPGGAVTLKTREAGGKAEIAVIDRGSGIDPKQLDSIFNPFFTTKPEGVGLGLAIVSKIVDEHGGKIAVESEPGKGSIFCVVLPMERPATAEQHSQT
jgi:two-component system, NtrC family, sensor histidine kinase HydH